MTIQYIKLDPTGNITVLVTTPVPRSLQGAVAARLLDPGCVGGEQVGYIEPPAVPGHAARLQMMGGEFCGNATMSLGAVLARKAGLGREESADLPLEVSGSDVPVPCRVRREGKAWVGTVRMPLPIAMEEADLDTDGGPLRVTLMRFPGIAHLVIPIGAGLDEAQLRRRLPQWNAAIGADALGALTWDAEASAIDPLVYVPSAGTLVREHGCGSGTAAIGCMLALNAGKTVRAEVAQPGGVIAVEARISDGRVCALNITGRVEIVEEGKVNIEV